MTLTILESLEQGSDEWHDQRRGMVTASVVGKLVTAKTLKPADNDGARGLMRLLVAERITGHTDPSYRSEAMWDGVEEEPRAREHYREHYAPVTECGFLIRDDWGFQIGCSPDGLIGNDGLLEIKAPRAKEHLRTILVGEVPSVYMPQIQCGLLVSGRDWCDFVSFYGGLPMWVKRVLPDPRWHEAIVAAVEKFEQTAEAMVTDYRALTHGLPATERVIEMEMSL